MKFPYLLPLFLLVFPLSLFGQNKVSKIVEENWDDFNHRWKFHLEKNWNYDNKEREILYFYRDSMISDFILYNVLIRNSSYNSLDNLVEEKEEGFGPNNSYDQLTTHTYNNQQELQESIIEFKNSHQPNAHYIKNTYERDEAENSHTMKYYTTSGTPDHWILKHKRDSFFNDEGCLIKHTIFNYHENGSIRNGRSWESTYAADCKMLKSEYYNWDITQNIMIIRNQHNYEYLNNGKTLKETYEKFNYNTNQWEIQNIIEDEMNADSLIVRHFVEYHYPDYIDTLLQLYTYTDKNETETFMEYKTRYLLRDDPLFLYRVDSFVYHYDAAEKLIEKEYWRQNYTNPFTLTTYKYGYYCDGDLKWETREINQNIHRTSYKYHNLKKCLEDGENHQLIVFPNPANRNFTIHSDLLAKGNSTVQVYSISGQAVFSEKIKDTVWQHKVRLPKKLKGQYIVTVRNEKDVLSSKILIGDF